MQTLLDRIRAAFRDEAGEGVISTGIVVLIMALLGATMWVAFDGIMESASDRAESGVDSISNDDGDDD